MVQYTVNHQNMKYTFTVVQKLLTPSIGKANRTGEHWPLSHTKEIN